MDRKAFEWQPLDPRDERPCDGCGVYAATFLIGGELGQWLEVAVCGECSQRLRTTTKEIERARRAQRKGGDASCKPDNATPSGASESAASSSNEARGEAGLPDDDVMWIETATTEQLREALAKTKKAILEARRGEAGLRITEAGMVWSVAHDCRCGACTDLVLALGLLEAL